MSEANFFAYGSLYKKLDTRVGERYIHKLALAREKKSKDLGNIRCIKSEDGRVLVRDDEIKGYRKLAHRRR